MTSKSEPTSSPAIAARDLIDRFSIEVTARSPKALAQCREMLAPGTEVCIAFLPDESYDNVIRTAAQLRADGLEPVPHLIARSMPDAAAFADFLDRLVGDAAVDRALVLGGDVPQTGRFASALELIETGLLPKCGIRRIGLALYPEPHPKANAATMNSHLRRKVGLANEQGLEPWLVNQFCFDPKQS